MNTFINYLKRQNTHNKTRMVLLCVFSFFLGTGLEKAVVVSLFILTGVSLFKIKLKDIHIAKDFTLAIILFALIVLNSLFHNEYKYIERNISFVLFPILLYGFNKDVIRSYNTKVNVIYCFSAGLIIYPLSIIIYYLITNTPVETGSQIHWNSFYELKRVVFSRNIFNHTFHNVYYSIYSLTSIVLLFYYVKSSKKLNLILSFIHFSLILLASSRISYFTLLVLILIAIFTLKNKKHRVIAFILITLTLITCCFLILGSEYSYVYHKLVKTLPESLSFRNSLWGSSFEIFKNNFFGIGFLDLHYQLSELTENLPSSFSVEKDINAHNQYLEYFCGLGIFGGIWFLITIGFIYYKAIYTCNKILFLLILILSIGFITESILMRQYGIVFSMFFITLFWHKGNEKSFT